MAPELRHLRHFVAVAEELNFTRAARRLFLAQQALSSSIKQLENELGQPLFVRDTRRVALTPAGETLLPRARRLLAMADETVATVRDGTPDRAVLRVDISSSNLETGALVLRRLRADRPDVEVRQREIGVPRGLVALREGELDVLLGDAAAAPDDVAVTAPAGVVFRPLVDPAIRFPWSVMWADRRSEPVAALLAAARAVAASRGWGSAEPG